MTDMSARFIGFTTCALLGFAADVLAQTAPPESEREASSDRSAWTIVVIKLRYADAEDIARVLRGLLPDTVRIEPYYPTNSVIVAADRAVIEELQEHSVEERPQDCDG
jgi:hypothetical protein